MASRVEKIPEEQLKVLREIRGAGVQVFSALEARYEALVDKMLLGLGIHRKVEGLKRNIKVDIIKGEISIEDSPEIIKV